MAIDLTFNASRGTHTHTQKINKIVYFGLCIFSNWSIQVDTLLAETESFVVSRLADVRKLYARTAREIHWKVTKASVGNKWFCDGIGKLLMKVFHYYTFF